MSGRVLIAPLDGKLPNLALMRLAAWERSRGADVTWRHELAPRDLFTPQFDRVYGSAIFSTSAKAVAKLRATYPHAIIGGEGGDTNLTVEQIVSPTFSGLDYSGYPNFTASIGYAMRGCRFKCDHCCVPGKEGKPRVASAIDEIWRGPGFPKNLHLLDNDFFGSPGWRKAVDDIVHGGYKVCLNQGVTARVMTDEQAQAIVAIRPRDDQFTRARLYVAWDLFDQERVFFRGIDRLEKAGWKPDWCFAYMLVGHDPAETWDRIWHRFNAMVARGIRPYPMVHIEAQKVSYDHWRRLKQFQRWVIRGTYKVAPFEDYDPSFKRSLAA